MRLYDSVDLLAEYAFWVRDRIGGIRADDLRVIEGHRCGRCGKGVATCIRLGFRHEPEGGTLVCSHCWNTLVEERGVHGARDASALALWEEDTSGEYDVIRGQVVIYPRAGDAEAHVVELAQQCRLLRRIFPRPRRWVRDRWDWALEAYRLWLHEHIGDWAAVAHHGYAQCEQWRPWWNEKTVHTWVPRVREKIEARALRRPRLLSTRRLWRDSPRVTSGRA